VAQAARQLFVVVGLAVMLGCLATLALLFVDLVQQARPASAGTS